MKRGVNVILKAQCLIAPSDERLSDERLSDERLEDWNLSDNNLSDNNLSGTSSMRQALVIGI